MGSMRVVFVALLACVAVAEHPNPGHVVELTSDNFAQVVNGELPVVLEFYATWCPHCKKFKTDYEAVATEVGQDFVVARVDGEKFGALADDFKITGYPTVKLLRKGVQATESSKAEEYEGAMKKGSLVNWLKTNAQSPGTNTNLDLHHLQP